MREMVRKKIHMEGRNELFLQRLLLSFDFVNMYLVVFLVLSHAGRMLVRLPPQHSTTHAVTRGIMSSDTGPKNSSPLKGSTFWARENEKPCTNNHLPGERDAGSHMDTPAREG